jgi:hypothetical protein
MDHPPSDAVPGRSSSDRALANFPQNSGHSIHYGGPAMLLHILRKWNNQNSGILQSLSCQGSGYASITRQTCLKLTSGTRRSNWSSAAFRAFVKSQFVSLGQG